MANGVRNLELAVQAINAGKPNEGARLIRIALRDPTMSTENRVRAHLWMAETSPDTDFKVNCYNDALALDPANEFARNQLNAIQGTHQAAQQPQIPLPPASQPIRTTGSQPSPTILTTSSQAFQPAPPITTGSQPMQPLPPQPATYQSDYFSTQHPAAPVISGSQPIPVVSSIPPASLTAQSDARIRAAFYRTVGITDGPNGAGTGFFIASDGLIATTRHVVSGRENVTLELEAGRYLMGKVVRSFLEYDLALIMAEIDLSTLLPFARRSLLPEHLNLYTVAHNRQPVRGRVRSTVREIKSGWFPTTIRQVPDAGGSPIFDDRNQVVGMLTRNASRSSEDVYGLLIDTILSLAEQHRLETRMDSNREYCPNCGHLSRAAIVGAHYCEICGSTLPHALALIRQPLPHMEVVYGESMNRPCQKCGARVGAYNGLCLRCGDAT